MFYGSLCLLGLGLASCKLALPRSRNLHTDGSTSRLTSIVLAVLTLFNTKPESLLHVLEGEACVGSHVNCLEIPS